MSKNIITRKGLLLVGRILLSCLPTRGKLIMSNHGFVTEMAKKGADINFNDFVSNLPFPDPKYYQMMELAISLGRNFIDEEVVSRFFGGEPHFEQVSAQLELLGFKKKYAKRIFFAHILTMIQVEDICPSVTAVYKNGDLKVRMSNLVSVVRDTEIRQGEKYLVHYSSIVAVAKELEGNVLEHLLEVQAHNERFVDACRSVSFINYANFWRFRDWTQKFIEEEKFAL